MVMRVREAILHSERQPEGAVTMARLVSVGRGKRIITIVQTKGSAANQVSLDAKEYKALVKFVDNKRPAKLGKDGK